MIGLYLPPQTFLMIIIDKLRGNSLPSTKISDRYVNFSAFLYQNIDILQPKRFTERK